jgi:hypothetical protein
MSIMFFYNNADLESRAQEIVSDIDKCFHTIIRDLWEYESDIYNQSHGVGGYDNEELDERDINILIKQANRVRAAISTTKKQSTPP